MNETMQGVTLQRTPELIAAEINNIKDQTRRVVLSNSIEIGRKLTEAQELVPHGEWGKWLETAVDYKKSTAANLMRIFKEYGADQISLLGNNVKSEVFERLDYSKAVALFGVAEEEREEFVKENNVEEMSSRELKKAIAELKQAKKDKEKLEEELANANKSKETLEGQVEEYNKQKESLNNEVEELKSQIADISNKDNPVIESLREEVKKKNEELNELQERSVEVREMDEEDKEKREAYEDEIKKLNEEKARLEEQLKNASGTDEVKVKLTVCIGDIQKKVNEAIDIINETDAETQKKYKAAIVRLTEMIKESVLNQK